MDPFMHMGPLYAYGLPLMHTGPPVLIQGPFYAHGPPLMHMGLPSCIRPSLYAYVRLQKDSMAHTAKSQLHPQREACFMSRFQTPVEARS